MALGLADSDIFWLFHQMNAICMEAHRHLKNTFWLEITIFIYLLNNKIMLKTVSLYFVVPFFDKKRERNSLLLPWRGHTIL